MAAYYDRKDYSRPLHVDCSVEYELPNAAKPPANARTEPLLMIHPCYYRRAESQRRSPFINNLPATTSRRVSYPRYSKRDPLLCASSGDSGVGLWTDTSPLPTTSTSDRLHAAGPDSGIVDDKGLNALTGSCWEASTATAETVSTRLYGSSRCQTNTESNRELRDSTNQIPRQNWTVNTDFLAVNCAEVNNNSQQHQHHSHHQQKDQQQRIQGPAVGVAAVAACKACQPQFLHPQHSQRPQQQPWPGVTAAAAAAAVACGNTSTSRHRVRAVEPGPEHTASSLQRRSQPWPTPTTSWAPPAKRSRLAPPSSECCKVCSQWNYPQCRPDNSRVLWNNESMLRLYQV